MRCSGNNGGMPVDTAFSRSRAEAMLALRLNDQLAEAHVSLGFIRWIYDADWAGADDGIPAVPSS